MVGYLKFLYPVSPAVKFSTVLRAPKGKFAPDSGVGCLELDPPVSVLSPPLGDGDGVVTYIN